MTLSNILINLPLIKNGGGGVIWSDMKMIDYIFVFFLGRDKREALCELKGSWFNQQVAE